MFRGQADSSWNLEPSFTRLVNKNNLSRIQALQLERECVNKFSVSASKMLSLDKTIELTLARFKSLVGLAIDFMGWFVVMQHFSAPTRQFDWNTSPWVALYFAYCEKEDCNGAIWIANFHKVDSYAKAKLNGGNFVDLMTNPESQDIVVFTSAFNTNERLEA